jgi:hypothetical protein
MATDIPIDDIEEFEQHQETEYFRLGLDLVDYSGLKSELYLTSDYGGILGATDGHHVELGAGSKYDHPAFRRKMNRIYKEFVLGCSLATKIESPILGMWPGKVPGGLYGDLPGSGRALILFTEGTFFTFRRLFSIVAQACPLGLDGFDSEDAAIQDIERWTRLPIAKEHLCHFEQLYLIS